MALESSDWPAASGGGTLRGTREVHAALKSDTQPNSELPGIRIRPAAERDSATIIALIRELADYERLLDQAVGTEDDIRNTLFGAAPQAEVILAELGSETVGFALFFHNYSTFQCRRGLYLEDLYVRPPFRGHGYGKQLLASLARLAVDRGCGRLEWAVLGWNEPSIEFYQAMGARAVDGWRLFRVAGSALNDLAAKA
jgi:GNAT superfamily N-acetyltransferase